MSWTVPTCGAAARRRTRPGGNAPSVLVGDFLYSRAFQLMVDLDDMDVMAIVADARQHHRRGRGAAARPHRQRRLRRGGLHGGHPAQGPPCCSRRPPTPPPSSLPGTRTSSRQCSPTAGISASRTSSSTTGWTTEGRQRGHGQEHRRRPRGRQGDAAAHPHHEIRQPGGCRPRAGRAPDPLRRRAYRRARPPCAVPARSTTPATAPSNSPPAPPTASPACPPTSTREALEALTSFAVARMR